MKTRKIITKIIIALSIVVGFLSLDLTINTEPVQATNGNVNVIVVPLKGKNIWGGREDYPVDKMRITVSGATRGNGGGWTKGNIQKFTVDTTRSGQSYGVTCEVIFRGNRRVVFQRSIWINSYMDNVYISPN